MGDTAESLWRELFETMDPPFVATDAGGELHCWFCGLQSPRETEQQHEPNCIWVRARALIAKPPAAHSLSRYEALPLEAFRAQRRLRLGRLGDRGPDRKRRARSLK